METVNAIRETVLADHDVVLAGVYLVPLRRLPRTTSGKLQRSLCRHQLLNGEFDLLDWWTTQVETRALQTKLMSARRPGSTTSYGRFCSTFCRSTAWSSRDLLPRRR